MTTFIALCRGRSLDDSRLLALSTDPHILAAFAQILLADPPPGEVKGRKRSPKTELLETGRVGKN